LAPFEEEAELDEPEEPDELPDARLPNTGKGPIYTINSWCAYAAIQRDAT